LPDRRRAGTPAKARSVVIACSHGSVASIADLFNIINRMADALRFEIGPAKRLIGRGDG
jgi:hypothetical protein